MSNKTSFLLVVLLIFGLFVYCIGKIDKEIAYIDYMHNAHMPQLAGQSFLVGCLYNRVIDVETAKNCKIASEAYRYDTKATLELTSDENNR